MNDNSCVSPEVCAARMSNHDDRFKRDKERLDKQENIIESLNDASIKLTQLIAIHAEDLKNSERRIAALEQRPSNLWDKVTSALISAIVGGLAAAVVAGIIR